MEFRPGLRFLALAIFAAALLPAAKNAAGARRPVENPTLRGSLEPNLLSSYERKTLQLEYLKLIEEIGEKRREAAADPSIAALKDRLAAENADERYQGGADASAARKISDAVETLLYSYDGIPAKIKRLEEVGRLLEYDLRLRREQRAANTLGRAVDAPGDGSEDAQAEGAEP